MQGRREDGLLFLVQLGDLRLDVDVLQLLIEPVHDIDDLLAWFD
jgi:hypothetical protein